MMDDAALLERAQTAELQLKTMRQAHEAAIARVRDFKSNFGVRERQNGEIEVDFDKLVDRVGPRGREELRKALDRHDVVGAWEPDGYDLFHMVERLGLERALAFRRQIDDFYRIKGGAGEKPRIRVAS